MTTFSGQGMHILLPIMARNGLSEGTSMARRKSFGKTFRVNTKGARVTSVSFGGAGMRVNVGSRGTRLTARNPITGGSVTVSGGGRRSSRGHRPAKPTSNPIWNQRTGIERISVPVSADDSIVLTVDLKHYTSKRLFAIRDATEKHDMKRQAKELFQFVTAWDIESKPGKTAPRSHKTLARLPHGLALALAIEVGNRSGVLVEPIDSGIVIRRPTGTAQRATSKNAAYSSRPTQEKKRRGFFRRLWPF